MNKSLEAIYSEAISLLDILEITIDDEKTYSFVRKKVLDLANDIRRFGENNGIT